MVNPTTGEFTNDTPSESVVPQDWVSSPNVLQTSKTIVIGTGPVSTMIDAIKGHTGRINPRVLSIASSAVPAINTDLYDQVDITALATAITSFTSGLSGNFIDGQKLIIRILDNSTAHAITWGASFASRGQTLPTTTVLSKYLYVGFLYNSTALTWDCVAVSQET